MVCFFRAIYSLEVRMKKLTLKDIDSLIEQSMTNLNIQSQVSPQNNVKSLTDPIFNYLDAEEQTQQNSIRDNNKIKNVIVNPNEKRSKEDQVRDSQKKIIQLKQMRDEILKKQEELAKAEQERTDQLKLQMGDFESEKKDLEKFRQRVNEMYHKFYAMPILKRKHPTFDKMSDTNIDETGLPIQSAPAPQPAPLPVVEKKPLKVRFEKSTNPFEVLFSERGFKIGNTRLSFETIEDALSKNITLTLDGGNGLVLDAVRMQKILKYKDRV